MNQFITLFCLVLSVFIFANVGASPEDDIIYRLGDKQHGTKKDFKMKERQKDVITTVGAVIAGVKLTQSLLNTVLNEIGSFDRKISIGVNNTSGSSWKAINIYFKSGSSDQTLPETIKDGEALVFSARKVNSKLATTGSIGVIAYQLENGKTLGILYKVPGLINIASSNKWNAKVFDGLRRADKKMYKELSTKLKPGKKVFPTGVVINRGPFKGNEWHEQELVKGELKMKGYMTSSGQAILEIRVMKEPI